MKNFYSMKKRKTLNIGCSDFKQMISHQHYYVDKSLLIQEVIENEASVLLLPRPRRFGKTLNLSMLRYFFDNSDADYQNLFTELKIWNTPIEIKEKQGKYPVIFLSFKDIKEENWNQCLGIFKTLLSDLYEKYLFLLNSDCLTDNEKLFYKKIASNNADIIDYQLSIKKLSEYLYRYHKTEVVILIDEYDTPILHGYKKYYGEVISFVRNMLSGAFKDNSFLYKGVISGILRVSKETIFSGLNNISVHSILDYNFSDKFGFVEEEVKQILEDFELTNHYEQIKSWYNGYQIGKTTSIYNPWSIINYAVRYQEGFKPYWVNTSSDELLRERINESDADKTRFLLQKLMNNEIIEKEIDENFVFPDLNTNKELLWTLLTFGGYLTVVEQININTYKLRIPNYELKFVFKNIILKWLTIEIQIQKSLLQDTTNYLINNEIDKFEEGFKQIMGDTFSYFDSKGDSERIYQSYVLGLLAIVGDHYIIKSNRESGEGRYDIMLIPHDKTKFGIVIEIKQIDKISNEKENKFQKRVNCKITEALSQIENNKYYNELIAHKIEKIIKLPIVFVGKEPYIQKFGE